MKKYLMTFLALTLGVMMANAHPVSLSTAKTVGQQFAQTKFESKSAELSLAYTAATDRGEACFYVFNVGEEGFIIVSADDCYRPIIGYSQEGAFDLDNPGLAYYLRTVQAGRSKHEGGQAAPAVAAEWQRVLTTGSLISRNGGRADTWLVETKWDQNYPYNLYCPTWAGGPGGHFYAGCVATAMSQVMKYWNHPLQGQGSHTYTWNPGGQQSANFGQTTYDWDNMPISLSSSSPQEQIDAVATLMFHCAVAVDMQWDYDGSGAQSPTVPSRISQYFLYSNAAVYQNRANFTAANWLQKVKESIDMGWPLYYSGYEQTTTGLAGHAFVVDGYNDEDLIHFNYGWSGTGNGFFSFEENEFNLQDGAIFNFVPAEVYNNTAQAPTALSVTPGANNALTATLTWTNPSKTMNNSNLTSIDKVVIMRGSEVIGEIANPAPGSTSTFVDNEVPRFDSFIYKVYAVTNDNHGKIAASNSINIGPTCSWSMMVSSSEMVGWRGGFVSIYNAAGTLVKTVTTTSSNVTTVPLEVPLGRLSFGWTNPNNGSINTMTIIIKNSNNDQVFTYTGAQMEEGIFFETNNGCGNAMGTQVPSNLHAVRLEDDEFSINVTWDGVTETGYGYNVYRDGLLYRTIPSATSFVDENVELGGHCYYATFLSYGGENDGQSNESCATAGEGCDPAKNLDYEKTGASFKIKLKWEKPEVTEGLSAFFVYRRAEGDSDWKMVKITGANSTSYTDNSLNAEGHYYYKVVAYYQGIECNSAPANWIHDENQFYLHVYWSPTAVDEFDEGRMSLYPNPAKDSFTVEGEGLQSVSVYNTIGQLVYNGRCEGNSVVINLGDVETGVYMVKVTTTDGEFVRKISVIR